MCFTVRIFSFSLYLFMFLDIFIRQYWFPLKPRMLSYFFNAFSHGYLMEGSAADVFGPLESLLGWDHPVADQVFLVPHQ